MPDWLLEPPPNQNSVYLSKKEITARVPFAVKVLYDYHVARLGRKGEEFEGRTSRERQITDSDMG